MEATDNQEVKNSRSKLRERYAKKYPDKVWEGENAESDENLYDYAADELGEMDSELDSYRTMNAKAEETFSKDRRAARSTMRILDGEDPAIVMVEEYGQDFLDALESEEGKEKFKAAIDKWKENEAKDKVSQEEFDANLGHTVDAMKNFADKNNIDDEKVGELISTLFGWLDNAVKGNITEDMLDAVAKANGYDMAVAEAREEGVINGRNEKIREKLKADKASPTNLPPTVGSRSESEGEGYGKSKTGTLSMFGGIPVRKK